MLKRAPVWKKVHHRQWWQWWRWWLISALSWTCLCFKSINTSLSQGEDTIGKEWFVNSINFFSRTRPVIAWKRHCNVCMLINRWLIHYYYPKTITIDWAKDVPIASQHLHDNRLGCLRSEKWWLRRGKDDISTSRASTDSKVIGWRPRLSEGWNCEGRLKAASNRRSLSHSLRAQEPKVFG